MREKYGNSLIKWLQLGGTGMLDLFKDFRKRLDEFMIPCINKRVCLYGYGRTGQFLEWYADYYHGIRVDYIVREHKETNIPYSFGTFAPSVFDFDYKDLKDAIVWIAFHDSQKAKEELESLGYRADETYYDCLSKIYGNDIFHAKDNSIGGFYRRKTANRDIQFFDYLEYKYDCNFLQDIGRDEYENREKCVVGYKVTAMREIFSILDKCHCIPGENDSIIDFGCGKGAALLAFLDYGFKQVCGIELERRMYDIAKTNFEKMGLQDRAELVYGDFCELAEQLDEYNWFYNFLVGGDFYETILSHICDSLRRKPRKVTIIVRNPFAHKIFEKYGFILTNQFELDTRQRVVNIYIKDIG